MDLLSQLLGRGREADPYAAGLLATDMPIRLEESEDQVRDDFGRHVRSEEGGGNPLLRGEVPPDPAERTSSSTPFCSPSRWPMAASIPCDRSSVAAER